MQNNDTIPMPIAMAIIGLLGVLIVIAFIFAGWSIIQLRNTVADRELNLGKTLPQVVPVFAEFEEEEYYEEYAYEYEEYEEYVAEIEYEIEETYEYEPEPEPEATPTPARPRATPAPAVTVTCHTCNGTGTMVCASCNGIGGGRGTPFVAGIPHEIAPAADVWWCRTCQGSATTSCATCGGAGTITVR